MLEIELTNPRITLHRQSHVLNEMVGTFLQAQSLLCRQLYTTCAVLAELGVRPAAERAARASVHSYGLYWTAL